MKSIAVTTTKREQFIDITSSVKRAVFEMGLTDGAVLVFVPHTTAGVTINENADPDVVGDILFTLSTLVPNRPDYQHFEGNSDAHVKSSLIGVSVKVMVENSALMLGRWQSIYFTEFDGPRNRQVWIKALT